MAVPAAAWAAWAQPLCKCCTRSGVSKAPSAPARDGYSPALGDVRGGGGCYCLPPAAFPHPGARLSDPGRRSGPPRRCAPHFPGRGEGGGRLSTVLAQELPGEVTGSRCSPWPSPLLPSHGGRRALSDRGRGTGDNFTPWAGHAHCWGAGGRGLLRVGGRGPHSPPQGPRCSRRLRL